MGRAEQILELAQEFIQVRGYNAFSFQDIADQLGIKKASIQFYYPRKVLLGCEVVRRYQAQFIPLRDRIRKETPAGWVQLNTYLQPFYQVSGGGNLVCLCGVLGGEFMSLPPEVQAEVKGFFRFHESWLVEILQQGREVGDFAFVNHPQGLAKTMLSALQGALIIARSQHSPDHFKAVVKVLKQAITP